MSFTLSMASKSYSYISVPILKRLFSLTARGGWAREQENTGDMGQSDKNQVRIIFIRAACN